MPKYALRAETRHFAVTGNPATVTTAGQLPEALTWHRDWEINTMDGKVVLTPVERK